jgi:uncharacterized SAM-binding protein YcdF (DUF218 family)
LFYVLSKVFWFFATPSNFLCVLALAGVGLTRIKRLRGVSTGLAVLGVLGLLAAGLSPLANWIILPLEDRFPAFRDDGRGVDGVVVLGGAVQAEESFGRDQLTINEAGERWLLVTSAWHMPRAVGCFRQAGFPVTAYPVDFRTRGPSDIWRTFTFASEGLRRLGLAAREWAGLVG